jgi:hypothetical protein
MPTPLPPAGAALPSARDLLGPAPLLPHDAADNFATLLARLTAAVAPADVVEEGWVIDVADLLWEAARLRRLKAAVLTACAQQGMWQLLWSINVDRSLDVSRRWAARDAEVVEKVEAVLAGAGLGTDHVMARTMVERIAEIERIDRMIAAQEMRRAAALREIAHHRAETAERLRGAAAAEVGALAPRITDAEFAEVAPAAALAHAPAAAATAAAEAAPGATQ